MAHRATYFCWGYQLHGQQNKAKRTRGAALRKDEGALRKLLVQPNLQFHDVNRR
jgi:hypothetical protein